MIKLRAPEGLTNFRHAGHAVEIGEDGSCLIDERNIADFRSHGFLPWGAPKPAHETLSHAPADPGIDAERVDVLRRLAQLPTADLKALLDGGEQKAERQDLSEADIKAMPRGKMFAWLKENGISAAPADNDESLRAKIRNAVG